MSLELEVITGWYIQAKPRLAETLKIVYRCQNSDKHRVFEHQKFCSECGGKVIPVKKTKLSLQLLYDILVYDVGDWGEEIAPEDKIWLDHYFEPLNQSWLSDREYEYILYKPLRYSATITVPLEVTECTALINKTIPENDIQRLVKLLKYLTVEVKFGTFVFYT